jgi:A/G-specific adenine glycosylase
VTGRATIRPVADQFVRDVLAWYAGAARDLPWRRADAGPWAVLVSEVMLQQTPVPRVLPVYAAWLARWPAPAALAGEPAGAAVRMWGSLGYPRRALRLHQAAVRIVEQHGGQVPSQLGELLALPGVGEYTARAVASFAFGQRHPVVDTNVHRVLDRVYGDPRVGPNLIPRQPQRAVRYAAAVMELGALVCRARDPRCGDCPVRGTCGWAARGRPQRSRRRQDYLGTDRAARGAVLRRLRSTDHPVAVEQLGWPDRDQLGRAVASLVADGLLVRCPDGYALPD